MNALAGRERAAALASAWAAHVGASGRTLPEDNDLSLGESGISYDPRDDSLHGRIWVTMALLDDATPEELANNRRMVVALNDPAVGGMFDRGGGTFVLNEQRQGYYLVRRFEVRSTTPEILIRDMERMQRVAGKWTTEWFFQVAQIMHGNAPPPKEPVRLP